MPGTLVSVVEVEVVDGAGEEAAPLGWGTFESRAGRHGSDQMALRFAAHEDFMDEAAADGVEHTQVIEADSDVVRVRQLVRAYAERVRLTELERVKAVTAASELARNTLIHGGGGRAEVQIIRAGKRRGVRMTFTDEGPGIANLEQAFTDGYSTRGGMGLGLPGARRLSSEFSIVTSAAGTVITAVIWERHDPR